MSKNVLRIKLKQNKAHYRKEESIDNKMTYPLPPFSTVIGAIHAACGYKEYHPMNISVQGEYESMGQEVYKDLCFLNSIMDDRGILVKLDNPGLYNESYKIIASAKKSQGNSFKNKVTIDISEPEILDEYIGLTDLKETYQVKIKKIKDEEKSINAKKKELKEKKKKLEKKDEQNSQEYEYICSELDEYENKSLTSKEIRKSVEKERDENVTVPLSYYASLTISLKRYEVLYGVNLILHIDSDEKTLREIEENIYNLVSLGRSEDFVEVEEIKRVEVTDDTDTIYEYISNKEFLEEENLSSEKSKENSEDDIEKNCIINEYSGYVDADALNLGVIDYASESINVESINVSGTTYFMNKNYVLDGKKRVFEKKRVVYLNGYTINTMDYDDIKIPSEFNSYNLGKNVYMDMDGYILNLI